MRNEINVAVELLVSYVQRCGTMKEESLGRFRAELERVLLERYVDHWYPGRLDGTAVFVTLSPSSL